MNETFDLVSHTDTGGEELFAKGVGKAVSPPVIESSTETVFDSFDDLRKEMIAEAGRLGGEALILGQESTDSEFIFTGIAMIKSDRRRMTGEVIVYNQGE